MNIANLILTVVVLAVAFAIVRRFIQKRQNEEADEQMKVDDRTYTLEVMKEFVKRIFNKEIHLPSAEKL